MSAFAVEGALRYANGGYGHDRCTGKNIRSEGGGAYICEFRDWLRLHHTSYVLYTKASSGMMALL